MGVFDAPASTPDQINTEGETITVSFLPGVPNAGQATVRWNIPAPARGCNADDGLGAYCGMVILVGRKALTIDQAPVDGKRYRADATVDYDLHAGDRTPARPLTDAERDALIRRGEDPNDYYALVVGAVYEGDKRAQIIEALNKGEETDVTLTTEIVINDLDPTETYYVVGYAVDCQGRYHRKGSQAYSLDFGDTPTLGGPGSQTIGLNEGEGGALPTDGTGLVAGSPGQLYEFEIQISSQFPNTEGTIVKVSGYGSEFGTYQDLIDAINNAIATQAGNPQQSADAPNTNRYYVVDGVVHQWDGTAGAPVDGVLYELTDPSVVGMGTYWYNPTTNELKRWNIPSPIGWNDITVIEHTDDPTNLYGGDDFWYDGTKIYRWCSTTWCEIEQYAVDTKDPTEDELRECSAYWFETDAQVLNNWNVEFQRWDQVFAIEWPREPNLPQVVGSPQSGDYWFDEGTNELKLWNGSSWDVVTVVISDDEPLAPVDGLLWYVPSMLRLVQWDDAGTQWIEHPVLTWPDDPTDTASCDLWWDTSTDKLYKWDSVHSEWDEQVEFFQSEEDPYAGTIPDYGFIWYNPDTDQMYQWDGSEWIPVSHINHPTDPTIPDVGTAWYNPNLNTWAVWGTPVANQWNAIDPIDTTTNPTSIPSGTLWYDTSLGNLWYREAGAWTPVTLTTLGAVTPKDGDLWYDTSNSKLMEWDSETQQWVPSQPLATAFMDPNGNITIETTATGSSAMVTILVPDALDYQKCVGLGVAAVFETLPCYKTVACHYDQYSNIQPPTTTVGMDTFMFPFLVPEAIIYKPNYGTDGKRQLPTYERIGVGDDGSADERRELATSIREQLGYPVVDVELTPKQIDTAIDQALEILRQRSSVAYTRGFFFLETQNGVQHYKLINERCGFHKVVTVMGAYRMTSAFLSSAYGSGVYGQVVLQHLYNMGTFDLVSYHLVAQYIEQLEHLFATRLTYHWHEPTRLLSFHQNFFHNEKILLDVTLERTEQEIMQDRWTKTWVERWALARSMEILAQTRGKFASLPGAGGGISLNAADLQTNATELKQQLIEEIDDYVVNDVEDLGMNTTFIIG